MKLSLEDSQAAAARRLSREKKNLVTAQRPTDWRLKVYSLASASLCTGGAAQGYRPQAEGALIFCPWPFCFIIQELKP